MSDEKLLDAPLQLEWMWADAKILPISGFGALASLNPMRWSSGSPDQVLEQLTKATTGRPVKLRISKQAHSTVRAFDTAIERELPMRCVF